MLGVIVIRHEVLKWCGARLGRDHDEILSRVVRVQFLLIGAQQTKFGGVSQRNVSMPGKWRCSGVVEHGACWVLGGRGQGCSL